jgi:hypothetical protein
LEEALTAMSTRVFVDPAPETAEKELIPVLNQSISRDQKDLQANRV